MTNTTAAYTHIDNELKENAESILSQPGISPPSAIQILYSQVVFKRGFPPNLRLPPVEPTAIGDVNQTELDTELTRGIESLKSSRFYTTNNVDAELAKEFGL